MMHNIETISFSPIAAVQTGSSKIVSSKIVSADDASVNPAFVNPDSTTTMTESSHEDDHVSSFRTYVYLNLWSETDPTEMAARIRKAMYAAGFSIVEESDKGYNQPAYHKAWLSNIVDFPYSEHSADEVEKYYIEFDANIPNTGTTTNITNNVTRNYSSETNTINLTATPTIETTTDNYLASTNDTTDRTADILAMLTATGYCKLGPGVFYVTELLMPDNTTLDGCGYASRLILADSVTEGYAVRVSSYCAVQNLRISGSASSISVPTTAGTRHGIAFIGDADAETPTFLPRNCKFSNCFIEDFTGGGITLENTGYPSAQTVIDNMIIRRCWAGINIPYFSEYNAISNVNAANCGWGVINNGGNNTISNCHFTSNSLGGLLMSNEDGDTPNNTHGGVHNCTFNHNGSNEGYAIKCVGMTNGEAIIGCNIFFGKVYIENSNGIILDGTVFGQQNETNPITVQNSKAILITNSVFQINPTIVESGNTGFMLSNCFNRTSGEQITL